LAAPFRSALTTKSARSFKRRSRAAIRGEGSTPTTRNIFVPSVNPIVMQKRLFRVSSADCGYPFGIGIEVTKDIHDIGSIGLDLGNNPGPPE
jgi:hypothetical protein